MESVKASYFKNHFGAVLDRAGQRAVRIERRGRPPAILISEEEYKAIRLHRLRSPDQQSAMQRLRALAEQSAANTEAIAEDTRAAAILKKHSQHLNS